MTCTNCNSSIDDDYVFCPKCHSTTVNYGKPVDYKTKLTQLLSIFILISIVSSGVYFILKNSIGSYNYQQKSSNSANLGEPECAGHGNSSCESEVKNDINKTPQWEVLSISHFGNGRFGVTYLAPSRTGGLTDYYAEYFTDCKCKIEDVKYKIAPPL